MKKSPKQLLYAHPYDMGGMPIRQPFPTNSIDHIGPFILLHHARIKVPTNIATKHAGVGPHPHRGFAPVTFIFEGGVHHRDSRGNDSIIYAGGTQWMNAGMGVIHSERPPENIHELGGIQELIQLWVNIPAKHKMDVPQYLPLTKEETPVFTSADDKARLNIISGKVNGITGPIQALSELTASTGQLEQSAKLSVELPENHYALIYVLSGKLKISDFGLVEMHHALSFNADGTIIELEALEDSKILLLSGKEIEEPMVAQGPFVMNSEIEIMQAYRDFQMGKMGVLIEE